MNDSPLADIRIGQVTHHWAQAQKIKSDYTKQIDSTSLKAKADAFSDEALNEQLILYVTDQQTAGRGRGQNTWAHSNIGSQLFSTWSSMIDQPAQPTLSPLIGLAVFRAAQSTWPFLAWSLKAPNDIYLGEKKVAGLLIETLSQGSDHRLLIGFGFNVISSPAEVKTATSLVESLSEATPLLAEDWIAFLERLLFEFSFSLQLSFENMNSTSTASLLVALNKHPLLKEKYESLDPEGNLKTATRNISWTEL
jgi:BirA family transcriptional regulator, biotin operon repressor / biotin---[acetyl-CoA-carboxylase] ligase